VFISSLAAQVGSAGRSAYGATKGAVEAFARGLAVEVAGTGVTVNCIAPGAVITGINKDYFKPASAAAREMLQQIPENRFGDPAEIAAAVRYLVGAPYCQGTTLHVDGGWSIS
jgi:NAD(P)-dependent dehydrogenase (short-subunit alcohol dehydrogenase family)